LCAELPYWRGVYNNLTNIDDLRGFIPEHTDRTFFDRSHKKDWTSSRISCIKIYRRSKDSLAKFEECLQRLEKIVQELERGEVPLEKSLTLFEEGMQLSSACRKELEQAEGKVEILLKKNGKLQAEPFEPLAEKAPVRR
jgi:exodeoxyribonuclease VII small subunit